MEKSRWSLVLAIVLIPSFLTSIPRHCFCEDSLKEIVPANVGSLEKLLSKKGSCAAFLDDRRLALGSSLDKKVEIWDVGRDKMISEFGDNRPVYGMTSSPEGSTLVTFQFDGRLRLWDPTNGDLTVLLDKGDTIFNSAAFSPGGELLAAGWADKTVTVFETGSWKAIQTLTGFSGWIYGLRFSSDGRLLATSEGHGGSSIKVWNVDDWTEICTFEGCGMDVHGMEFSHDNKVIASGSKTLRLWSIEDKKQLMELPGHHYCLFGIRFSPNGLLLATTDNSGAVRLWDYSKKECLRTIQPRIESSGVRFSPDGKRMVVSSFDNQIQIWGIPE
jgi:WD40 repeat protein